MKPGEKSRLGGSRLYDAPGPIDAEAAVAKDPIIPVRANPWFGGVDAGNGLG